MCVCKRPPKSRVKLAGSPGEEEEVEEMVQIRLEERCFLPVSKKKLLEQSDYFRALYRSGMLEARRAQSEGPDVQQLRGLSAPGLRLVLDFINAGDLLCTPGAPCGDASDDELDEEGLLAALVEAASFLQVTSLLRRLLSHVQLPNCLQLHRLAQVYGLPDLQRGCLRFMAGHLHQVLRLPHFQLLHAGSEFGGGCLQKQTLLEARLTGATPVLLALGDFCLGGPPSMLRYEERTERWCPLACSSLPPDLVNVRGYGAAVLDNYLFVVGGYRLTSQEIAAAHCYNPCTNEWLQVASMNQKR